MMGKHNPLKSVNKKPANKTKILIRCFYWEKRISMDYPSSRRKERKNCLSWSQSYKLHVVLDRFNIILILF